MTSKKTISIITPCYNEEANVLNLYNQVRAVMAGIGRYEYEHIFIDNHSRDNTVAILKMIAAEDPNVKVIVNARNFGHIRSPIHALMQARGDAMIGIVADLQDPPPMIADLIREWENGAYCVLGIKRTSEEHSLMFWAPQAVLQVRRAPLAPSRPSRTTPASASTIARSSNSSASSTIHTPTSAA